MSFQWEIYEPVDHADAEQGGDLNLESVKAVIPKSSWSVQTPDSSKSLDPQPSGEIDLAKATVSEIRSRLSPGVVSFGLMVLIGVVGLFALVVCFIMIHDALRGHLTFEQLLWALGPLLLGLDLGQRLKSKS